MFCVFGVLNQKYYRISKKSIRRIESIDELWSEKLIIRWKVGKT